MYGMSTYVCRREPFEKSVKRDENRNFAQQSIYDVVLLFV